MNEGGEGSNPPMQEKRISRRTFLKAAGVGVLTLGASLIPDIPSNNMSEVGEAPKVGLLDSGRRFVASLMAESPMPTEGYKSTVGVFGGRLVNIDGKLVWDNTGFISKSVDRPGDIGLRNYDEHMVKEPFELLRRHPKWFYQFLFPGPKRYRGNAQEVDANVQRLSLTEYYGLHPKGIEIKKPEVFRKGVILQDIYRADLINAASLNDMDRFQALAAAAYYIRSIHDQYGGIGELLVSDIIFQNNEAGLVSNPVLNLPDIIYNPEKRFPKSGSEQKATDMLDFLFSVGVEELRRSDDFTGVTRALNTVLDAYGDKKVIAVTASLAKRGRLTLKGLGSQHNKTRLGIDEKYQDQLRQTVIRACLAA